MLTNRVGIYGLRMLGRAPLTPAHLNYLGAKVVLNSLKCGVSASPRAIRPLSASIISQANSKTNAFGSLNAGQSRCFSTGLVNLKYYRPPNRRVQFSRSPISRFFGLIPDWIKFLSGFVLIAYLVIFIVFPFIFMVLPPLVLLIFGLVKLRNFRYNRQMKRIWDLLKKSTLIYTPKRNAQFEKAKRTLNMNEVLFPTLEETEEEIAKFSLNRIYESVIENDKGIADFLKTRIKTNEAGEFNVNQLALGSVEDQDYDWQRVRVPDKPTGMMLDAEELMSIRTRPLFDKYSKEKLAIVQISVKLQNIDGDFLNNDLLHAYLDKSFGIFKNTMVIEVIPIPSSLIEAIGNKMQGSFIIDEPSQLFDDKGDSNDTILDVKGTTKDRDP